MCQRITTLIFTVDKHRTNIFNWIDFGRRLSALVKFFYKQTYWQRLAEARTNNEIATKHLMKGATKVVASRCAVKRKCIMEKVYGKTRKLDSGSLFYSAATLPYCYEHVAVTRPNFLGRNEISVFGGRTYPTVVDEPSLSFYTNTGIVIKNQLNAVLGDLHVVIMTHSDCARAHNGAMKWLTSVTNVMPDICQRVFIGNLHSLNRLNVGIILLEFYDGNCRELSRDGSTAVLQRLGLASGIPVHTNCGVMILKQKW